MQTAPEQVGGGSVTIASDIYALGVLLYVLLTGQRPCGEITSPVDLLKAIVDATRRRRRPWRLPAKRR